jgi:hypothetical protein
MAIISDQTDVDAIDRLYSIRGGQITGIQDLRS